MNEPLEARSAEGRLAELSTLALIGRSAGMFGAAMIVFGGVLYAIDPGALGLTLINLTGAILCFSFYAATNLKQLGRVVSGRSTPLLLLEAVLFAGVLAAVIGANWFASESTTEWDLTYDQLFTLSPQSQEVAGRLSRGVEVIGFYKPADTTNRARLERLVDLYRRHTPHISVAFINPDTAAPAIVKKFQMSAESPRIVVATDEGRNTKIADPSEEALTNALVRVAEKAPRKVYFLGGHGEGRIDDDKSDGGYAKVAQDLVDDGYEVADLSLLERENLPQDASVLVAAGSRSALFPHEVQAIHGFLKRGGRAAFLLEPGVDSKIDEILRPFGVEPGPDLVVDPNPAARALGFGVDAPVVTKFETHPITNPLAGQALLFYWVRSVTPKLGIANVLATTLVLSSPASWGETSYASGGDLVRDESDVPGPVPLAVAVTKRTMGATDRLSDEARLVVIGDSSFATNRFVAMSGNGDFFLNAVSWLAGEEQRITIRPRQRGASRIPLTEAQQYGIVFFSVNLLPLLIVGLGLSVWAARRRR